MKKILILYASYGSGHKTVAQYLYNFFKEKNNYEIKLVDIMDYKNVIGKLSIDMFNLSFKYSTVLLNDIGFEFFDNKITSSPYRIAAKAVIKNDKFKKDVLDYRPDLLISSHFFGGALIAELNKKEKLNCKILTIITDYKSHAMWSNNSKYENAIIVGNEMVKNELISHGVDSKKIYTYGIPISENFRKFEKKDSLFKKYSINSDYKTFLFFGGGSIGSTFSYNYLKKLLEQNYNINIIFVCGKNEKLKEKVDNLIKEKKYNNIISLGFVNNVSDLMNISDVIITKPGGITITECLEMKKPMLLIPGNGGQEKYNSKFLCKNGYAYNCISPVSLHKNVNRLLCKKNVLNNMIIKLDKYKKNNSIEKIYELTERLLKK